MSTTVEIAGKTALVTLLTCAGPVPAGAELLPLEVALERLAQRGHTVVYSDDLIEPGVAIDLTEPSPAVLNERLQDLGLQLERIGDHWIISRLQATGSPERAEPAKVLPPILESVIVTGTRHHLSGQNVTGSLTSLSGAELAAIPSLGEDSMRAAAQLPGISSVGVSAKPWIRGGLQDELLVRFDGVELLDAYHLADFQSVFSIVDDSSVAAVDVYTGGFPARYGNRMSGVMDIVTGLTSDPPRTELGVSLFSLLANRQGSLNGGATRYLGSVRRGNLDQMMDLVDPSIGGTPRYYDAYGRLEHQLDETGRLSVGGLVTRDDVTLEEDDTRARSFIDSRYLWGQLTLDHGGGLTSSNQLTYVWSRRSRKQSDLDDDTGIGGFLDYGQALWKLAARSDFALDRGTTRMEFGAHGDYGRARYTSLAAVDRGIIGLLLGGVRYAAHDIDTDPEGWFGGVYWAGEFRLTEHWLVQPGIRWDLQDLRGGDIDDEISPRLGVRYRPTEFLTARFDAGQFHQAQGLHELPVADGEAGFSRPQRADHYIVGLEWLISDAWEIGAEVYEKRYRRPRPRFENVFNPFVLVPELEPDRIAIVPQRARARGADLKVSRRLSGQASAALSYSYMDAEDRLAGGWVPRRWSQRHTARASLSWQGPALTAALAVTWHSGWRGAELPDSIETAALLDTADVLNTIELRDFISVDLSASRTWHIGRTQITASASIINLTNRRNLAGIEYDATEEDGIIVLERERENLLPLVPSVGVLVTF